MDKWLGFLNQQKSRGLLRKLNPAAWRKDGKIMIGGKEYFDFSSNDYLGFSNHPKLIAAAQTATEKFGTSAGASRLLSGDLEIFHQLEESIARLKQKPSALVFNSGFAANFGIIPTLIEKGDVVFSDRQNHASILDGIQLSGAQMFRFHHNQIEHLTMLLKKYRHQYRRALIVTESIFSMDGDRAPLKEIVNLKEKFGCLLMVDEAHATGIFGVHGAGLVEEEGLSDAVDIIMGTFGKALGSFGAYVAADKILIQYLINTCRSFIYSTALPPATTAANLAAIDLLKTEPDRRRQLLKRAQGLRDRLIKLFPTRPTVCQNSSSQIIPLVVGDNTKAVALSRALQNAGYWVLPIRPPTVPPNTARLRFSLSFFHQPETLGNLAKEIAKQISNGLL